MLPSVFLIWLVSCAYFQGFLKQSLTFGLLRVRWCFPLWSIRWLSSLQFSEMLLLREPPPALCCPFGSNCLPVLHLNVSTHPLSAMVNCSDLSVVLAVVRSSLQGNVEVCGRGAAVRCRCWTHWPTPNPAAGSQLMLFSSICNTPLFLLVKHGKNRHFVSCVCRGSFILL